MFDFRECFILLLFAQPTNKFATLRHGGGGGGGAGPGLFSLGAFPTSEVTFFFKDACMLNPVREGEED